MRRSILSIACVLLAATAAAGPVAATQPTKVTLEIPPYTLEDALADYVDYGEYAVDCGDFQIITTFAGTVTVTEFGDRMLRQVSFEGRYYNASDTSKSALRIGRTATWRDFDEDGALQRITIHGVANMAVLPTGRHLVSAGIVSIDFTVDPPELAFQAGSPNRDDLLCNALR